MPLAESRSYGFADVGRASMPARNVLISVSVLVVTSSASVVAQELAVGIFGGSFLDNTKICHAASFEKATGAKVNFVLGNSVQNAAKLRARRGRSDLDVAYMDLQIVEQAKGGPPAGPPAWAPNLSREPLSKRSRCRPELGRYNVQRYYDCVQP